VCTTRGRRGAYDRHVTPDRTADGGEARALAALHDLGVAHRVTRHGRVGSLEEAAAARGVEPADVVKTLVVRRAADDYLFVLVPGDREISWPKLRAHLGVNRVSMPDADTARDVTGYVRGTITPFGSTTAWPVVADATMTGRPVSIGAGAFGVAATVEADDVVRALGAEVADVTDPA
jgi:Cys-tRNA(Pro)/Cys-tRNA(Cys) deacylase